MALTSDHAVIKTACFFLRVDEVVGHKIYLLVVYTDTKLSVQDIEQTFLFLAKNEDEYR